MCGSNLVPFLVFLPLYLVNKVELKIDKKITLHFWNIILIFKLAEGPGVARRKNLKKMLVYNTHKKFHPISPAVLPAIRNISIYKFGLSVCLFVSNKRQTGWTDWAQIFCGTSRDHREGLWMIKIKSVLLRFFCKKI